jgi:hypothetical protein
MRRVPGFENETELSIADKLARIATSKEGSR